MTHIIIKGWGDYNGSIIYVTYSEEKHGYLQDGDDVNIIPVSEIKPVRLDDSRISHFRIVPSLSETDRIKGKETTDCFLEDSFEYKGKWIMVLDLIKGNKIEEMDKMEFVDELQMYLSQQNELIVNY